MKKIIAISLLLTSFAMVSYAQDTPAKTKQVTKKEERKKEMAALNLSSDQKKQMKEVNKDFKDKRAPFSFTGLNSLYLYIMAIFFDRLFSVS